MSETYRYTEERILASLPKRKERSNKGTYGKVLCGRQPEYGGCCVSVCLGGISDRCRPCTNFDAKGEPGDPADTASGSAADHI